MESERQFGLTETTIKGNFIKENATEREKEKIKMEVLMLDSMKMINHQVLAVTFGRKKKATKVIGKMDNFMVKE